MRDIIKKCLDVDDSKRYTAKEIVAKIKGSLQR